MIESTPKNMYVFMYVHTCIQIYICMYIYMYVLYVVIVCKSAMENIQRSMVVLTIRVLALVYRIILVGTLFVL